MIFKTEIEIMLNEKAGSCFVLICAAGAMSFVMSLLEPDPDKRPSVRAAMEKKWINEGFAKKPLHTLSHKNR